MLNKLDDPDCEAKKIDQPTLDDGGDRILANQPFNYSSVVELTVPITGHRYPLQLTNRLTLFRCIGIVSPMRLSRTWNVDQSDHIFFDPLITHKTKWRSWSGEIWLPFA